MTKKWNWRNSRIQNQHPRQSHVFPSSHRIRLGATNFSWKNVRWFKTGNLIKTSWTWEGGKNIGIKRTGRSTWLKGFFGNKSNKHNVWKINFIPRVDWIIRRINRIKRRNDWNSRFHSLYVESDCSMQKCRVQWPRLVCVFSQK